MKRMLIVSVLAFAANLLAQPMIPREYQEPPPPAPYDSSQELFGKIVGAKMPVLVDFWASWCGPCRMLDPVMDTIKKAYKGRVQFIKVNVDAHRQISGYFRVQGIPAVFIIADTAIQQNIVGYHPRKDYTMVLDSVLKRFNAKHGTEKPPPAPAGGAKKSAGADTVKKAGVAGNKG